MQVKFGTPVGLLAYKYNVLLVTGIPGEGIQQTICERFRYT